MGMPRRDTKLTEKAQEGHKTINISPTGIEKKPRRGTKLTEAQRAQGKSPERTLGPTRAQKET